MDDFIIFFYMFSEFSDNREMITKIFSLVKLENL